MGLGGSSGSVINLTAHSVILLRYNERFDS